LCTYLKAVCTPVPQIVRLPVGSNLHSFQCTKLDCKGRPLCCHCSAGQRLTADCCLLTAAISVPSSQHITRRELNRTERVSFRTKQSSEMSNTATLHSFDMTLAELAAKDQNEESRNKRPRQVHDNTDSKTRESTNQLVPIPVGENSSQRPRHASLTAQKPMLQQLLDRATTGRTKLIRTTTPRWSRCPWLHLNGDSGATNTNPNHMPTATTAMAFDRDGVLLAVATSGKKIHLWDWDTVLASDIQGRIDFQKDALSPMHTMTVPHNASDLRWNGDLLAVAFRATSQVHLYNMELMCNSPSKHSAACTVLKPPSLHHFKGPKCLSFLPDNHFVAFYPCGHACLWAISPSPTLRWTWKCAEPVATILPIANNLILLGGVEGAFVLLDWKKTTRKAFASDKTPTVVARWTTHNLLQKQHPIVTTARDLGVQAMVLDTSGTTTVMADVMGPCRLTWITAGGWALSMDPSCRRKRLEILHAPPKIKTLTFDSLLVPTTTGKFSSPTSSIVASSSDTGGLLWLTVPQTTHVLPPHDNRVCQQYEVRIGKEVRLGWISDGNAPQLINLKRPPSALVVHPSKEWIVVATESSKLLIFNARSHPPDRRSEIK
jgi:WD40 repeat protein